MSERKPKKGIRRTERQPVSTSLDMTNEWQCHEVADLIAQDRLVVGDGYRSKNDELGKLGLPFARAGNINEGFQFTDADRFPIENLGRVGNKISQPGDVVFTSKGTVGRFAFVKPDTQQFVYSPQLCFWRSLDRDLIDSRFLYYWMLGPEFYTQFKGVAGQTDMAEYVNLTDQRRMQITIPKTDEQRTIAHILGTLDDKIELNRKMNETLEALARALFKSWFVDFDPVRAKAEGRSTGLPACIATLFPDSFEDSELGEIPAGWSILGLDQTARFLNGLALQKFPPKDDRFLPVIKIAQLRTENTAESDKASADLAPEYVVEDGDVLFSWSGSLECVLWAGGRGALNQHLFKVTSDKFPKWFYFLGIHQHLDEFRQIAADKATTMGHIQRHHLTAAKVIVPPAPLLRAMNCHFAPLIDQIVQLKRESKAIAAVRDSLLPRLISGELRINVAESFVGEGV
jgi:type I restriction enzyme, S subunit